MGEIKKLKLVIAIIAIILGLMILLFELLWWRTYQTGFVIVGAVSVFVMVGGFFLIWRQYRKKSGEYKDNVAESEVQKKDLDTEKPLVKKEDLRVGIILIVIGIIILIVGIVLYPTSPIWHSAGGLGLFGLNLLGFCIIIPGIYYPYRKRIKAWLCCIMLFSIILLSYVWGYIVVVWLY